MMTQWTVALMMASLIGGQTAGVPAVGAPGGTEAAPAQAATLVVPAGTRVALTLLTPIQSKATKVGDTVRAVVAFPVTVDAQVAIPAGTYVEGLVNAMGKQQSSVRIHFTRVLFANGYSVPLDAMNTHAQLEPLGTLPQRMGEVAFNNPPSLGVVRNDQEPPQPAPLPPVGPSKGAIIGASIGGMAALTVLSLVMIHHRVNGNAVLLDSGWQFQMVLQTPLQLDSARVAAAASLPATP